MHAEDPAPTPRRIRGLFALLALGVAILVGLGAARMLGLLVAGRNGLRWADEEGAWHGIEVEQAARRLWGPTDAFLRPEWKPVGVGLALGRVPLGRLGDPIGFDLVLIRVDPAHWRFEVWGRGDWKPASVATLATEAGVQIAVNASFFADDGPLGLVISDGVRRNAQGSRRAAHFLVVRGRPRILNQKRAPLAGATEGFQGFPAIMSGGRTFAYLREGGRGFDVRVPDRRTAACVDRDGAVVLAVTDTRIGGVSLEELATLLGGLGCVDAMGFDGGGSTGLWMDWGGLRLEVGNPTPVPVILGLRPT